MGLFGQAEPEHATVKGHRLRCEICHHDQFWHRHAQLHTAVASFFNLEWVQPSADCYRLRRVRLHSLVPARSLKGLTADRSGLVTSGLWSRSDGLAGRPL